MRARTHAVTLLCVRARRVRRRSLCARARLAQVCARESEREIVCACVCLCLCVTVVMMGCSANNGHPGGGLRGWACCVARWVWAGGWGRG